MKPEENYYITNCPFCNGNDFELYLSSSDFFLSKEDFNIELCHECGFKFTNPRPFEQNLSKYYESSDYVSHSNIKSGLINKIYHIVRLYTIKSKIRLIKNFMKSGIVLDIGCGSGEFLNELQKNHYRVTGIEPNKGARDFAIEHYNLNVVNESEIKNFKKSQFDVITMWHVLEHIYDLDGRIEQIQNLLNSDGILIVAVPNSNSWDAKYYRKYWAAYDLPRHLYHFESSTVIKLFEKYGFKIIMVRPMIFDALYISLLSEKYKTGKSNFISGMIIGFISNILALLNGKNYSSLTYVFKYK